MQAAFPLGCARLRLQYDTCAVSPLTTMPARAAPIPPYLGGTGDRAACACDGAFHAPYAIAGRDVLRATLAALDPKRSFAAADPPAEIGPERNGGFGPRNRQSGRQSFRVGFSPPTQPHARGVSDHWTIGGPGLADTGERL